MKKKRRHVLINNEGVKVEERIMKGDCVKGQGNQKEDI